MSNLIEFYKRAKKSVHGALVAIVPVLVVCDNANVSVRATVLACAGALVGVGTSVYHATNENQPA